jgi:protein-S-isoprenylcysteine O-methyltransferase Ste14
MERLCEIAQLAALALFLLLFLGRTIHLRAVRGVNPIRIARGKPLPEALIEGLLLIGLPLWLYEVLAYAWPLPFHLVPESLGRVILEGVAARAAGAALVAAGLALFGLALAAFGDGWRVGIDTERPGALVTRGVFRLSRNPIFVFMNLYAWGTFLLSGRLFFLVFAAVASAGLHAQIRREESFLADTYGEAYRAYCAATPRYLVKWPWGALEGR